MPCEDCGHLLCVAEDRTSLFCPHCRSFPVESQAVVNAKTNWLLKDRFTDENIIGMLQKYDKSNLIYQLLIRLNQVCNKFFNELEAGLPVGEFSYLTYIIKQVYEGSGFGHELPQESPEFTDEIKAAREAYTRLINAFRDAQNEFSVCIKRDGFTGQMENFTADYELLQSEYGLCFERCTKSIVGGELENFEDYSYVADVIRAVDKTDVDDIESPRDFADAWYQVIQVLRLIASADDMVGDTYFTRLPEEVTVFDISEFLDRIDSVFSEEIQKNIRQNGFLLPLDPDLVDRCGRQSFGENWEPVRDQVIVSEDNMDAHPFLFELDVIEERNFPGSRRPRHIPTTKVFYPRSFARLMKFQIFPMLKNGEDATSHVLLTDLTGIRGDVYERNLYEFFTEKGIECYHSAEITRRNQNEIDLLCVFDDRIVFIEVKYLLPPIRINGREGIRVLNEKFDRMIFNEVKEESNREAEGKPFPEKVEAWMELDSGESFTWQVGPAQGNRDEHVISEEWNELDVKKYVISNVVPSYIMKEGVRFLTDLELYRLIEHEEKDILYSLP